MFKKNLLLFVLLTTIVGSVWADEVTFNFTSSGGIDPNSVKASNGATTTWVQSPFTFEFRSAGENKNVSAEQSGYDRGLKLQTNASFSISTSDVVISSINLTYNNAIYTATATSETSEETIPTTLSGTTQTVSGSFQSVAFTNNTSNNIYISEITITYETIEENTYTSPKTWTFNSSRTAAATLTANSYWSQDDGTLGLNGLYIYQLTTSNEPLYISATALLPETKGLVFTSNSVGDIFTDNTTDLTLRNGASVTIPNAKAGQTIEFQAYFWNDEVVSLTNATVKGTSNTSISVTAGSNEVTNQLTVTADGPVKLTTVNNANRLNLRYITINGGPITTFRSQGAQTYAYTTDTESFSHTVNVNPKDALPYTTSNTTNDPNVDDVAADFVTVSSSDENVISTANISLITYNTSNGRLVVWGLKPVGVGTATLTFIYKGGFNNYLPASLTTATFTITGKDITRFSSQGSQNYEQTVGTSFNHTAIIEPSGALPHTSSNTTNDPNVDDVVADFVTVTSSDPNVISTNNITMTYNSSNGRISVWGLNPVGAGTATLTFNYKGGYNNYESATYHTTQFTVRDKTTLTFANSSVTENYVENASSTEKEGQAATVTYPTGDTRTITYTSSNTDVIEITSQSPLKYKVKGTGTVTITASVPANNSYAAATATYTIDVTAPGNMTFKFLKDITYLNQKKSVYLDLSQSGLNVANVKALYLTVTDPDNHVAYIEDIDEGNYVDNSDQWSQLYAKNVTLSHSTNEGVLTRVYVKVTESGEGSVGDELNIVATIIYNYEDINGHTQEGKATTSTKVVITAEVNRNFSFTKREGVAFVGDFVGIPGITGNSSANSGKSYVFTGSWNFNDGDTNTKTYRPDTNTPDYSVNDDSKARIISTTFDKFSSLRDTLLVYALAPGDVTITATDKQNSTSDTYTLHIYNRTDVEGIDLVQTSKDAISHFPYTWDFSQGFDEATKNAIINDENYWTHFNHDLANSYVLLDEGDYSVNFGYSKQNLAGSGNKSALNFTAGDELLTPFKGITTVLGSSNPSSIFGRLVVHTNAQAGEPGFSVSGGHHFYLTELADAAKVVGKPYTIYVKAGGRSTGKLKIGYATSNKEQIVSHTPAVYAFPMGANATTVDLEIENCDIYWIAASTEARTIGTASGTDGTLASQHLATYSYDAAFDFDLDKLYEAEKIDAWEVAAVGHTGNVFTATLSKIEHEMPANTGVILRQTGNTTNSSTSAYMIAKAKNTAAYTSAESIYTNHLIGTGMNGVTLYAEAGNNKGTESGNEYLTYIMSSQYFWGRDNDKGEDEKYNNYAGYGFFKIGSTSIAAPAQMAYLVVNKNEYDDVLMGGGANPSDGGGVKMLLVFGDEYEWTNNIEDIRTNGKAENNTDEYYYTLQGNRIAQPTKSGVYIHQGKKIYVK